MPALMPCHGGLGQSPLWPTSHVMNEIPPSQPDGPGVTLAPDDARARAAATLTPRHIGLINGRGLWTLYLKEIHRFLKVWMQALAAPLITTLLFLAIFTLALGDRVSGVGSLPFDQFLAPGLVMMSMVQGAFANNSSSLLISKVQNNIFDVMMPPLSSHELTFAFTMAGVTRGLMVGLSTCFGMWLFVDMSIHNLGVILYFGVMASLFLSLLGLLAGIWADKFDHVAAITNFIITPLAFLSGTFYSIERLPGIWNDLAHLNPFFYMIDGFRSGFIGHSDAPIWLGMLVLFVLNAALWWFCHHLFVKGYKLKT